MATPKTIKSLARRVKVAHNKKMGLSTYYMREHTLTSPAQVVVRKSKRAGHSYISWAQVGPEHRGKGFGQAMYLRILRDTPLVNRPPISEEARRVRRKLTQKGLAVRKGNALYSSGQDNQILGPASIRYRLGGI